MFTIIGGDGKEYGPVSVEQIQAWLASGRANLDTRAKHIGYEEWKRLGDFDEFAGPSAAPPPPLSSVEPEPDPTGPVDPKAYAARLIARAAPLNIGDCLDRGWKLLKANFWPLVGVTFLIMLVSNIVALCGKVLPWPHYYVGTILVFGPNSLVSILLSPVFNAGLYNYYLMKIRGQPTDVGDAFKGFTAAFVPLVVLGLVTVLITAVGFTLLILPGIYLCIAYMFAVLLVIDKKMAFWPAMEVSRRVISSQWWSMLGLALLGGLIAMLGLVGLFIGIFITLPIMFGAIAYAYEDLCNPRAK
jgi:GYF domain 2